MNKTETPFYIRWATELPFHPWPYFFLFLAANTFLSYSNFSIQIKLWIGLWGILVPFIAGLHAVFKERKKGLNKGLFQPDSIPIPIALWFLLAALLGLARFYRLTDFPFWPIGDEGIFAMIAQDLQRSWSWKLLLGENQWEPLYAWVLSGFLRFVPLSLTAIRLLPSLISLMSVAATYLSIRLLLGSFPAFLAAWTLALSFWPWIYGRICIQHGLLVLWEFLALGAFALLMNAREVGYKHLLLSSVILGSGFYIFTTWPLVAFVIGMATLVFLFRNGYAIKPFLKIGFLVAVTLLLSAPMIAARFSSGGMSHIHSIFQPSTIPIQAGRYFVGLFWYGFNSGPWGPQWGGFLNPILASIFFLGTIETVRSFPKRGLWALGGSFFLFLLPGVLSTGYYPLRISALLPLMVLFIVVGLKKLLEFNSSKTRWALFFLIWIPSIALDAHHYLGPYNAANRNSQYFQAYQILRDWNAQEGPLCVFSEFNMDYDNKLLNIACRPFDVLQNSSLEVSQARWAVLVLNRQYIPFLLRRFPGSHFKILSKPDKNPLDPPPFALVFVPLPQIPGDTLDRWRQADLVYRQVNIDIKNKSPYAPWIDYSKSFSRIQDLSSMDPFLMAVYFEKTAFFQFLGGDFQSAARSYEQAIKKGLPAAHLFYNLGVCLHICGREKEADQVTQKATQLATQLALETGDSP